MSTTTEDPTEQEGPPEATEWPEDWPVATRYGDRTIFSGDVQQDLRVGGVVHAVEVLADVQEAVRDHLKRAFDSLEHEGVKHTVGNAIDLAHESATILERAAVLYWMERKGEVEVSAWPVTRIDYGWSSDASDNGDGAEAHPADPDDPLSAFEAVRRDTLEDVHEALLISASIINRHVDERAWDTLGTVGYLERVSGDLEDALGLDRNEVEELVNEASVRADELLGGEDDAS